MCFDLTILPVYGIVHCLQVSPSTDYLLSLVASLPYPSPYAVLILN